MTLILLHPSLSSIASAGGFFDGTFSNGDWSTTQLLSGTHNAFQVASGGNTGEFRQTNHANLDTGQSIIVYHLSSAAVYDPGTSGGISTIDFSLDVRFLGGSAQTLQVGYRLVLEQAGAVYFADPVLAVAEGPGDGLPQPNWASFAYIDLVDSDFLLLDGAGTLDLSSTGDPIRFGYLTLNTVTLDNTSTSSGIDNWLVTVHSIPEPDTDGDGVFDDTDNCITFANASQLDSNGDGFGNACDADLTGSCNVSFGDLSAFKAAFPPNPFNPDADFTENGLIDFGDLARLKQTFFNGAEPGPGPSAQPNACDGS